MSKMSKINDFFNQNNNIVSMSDYIAFCLYGKLGFYTSQNAFGKCGHFITSPQISSIFSDCIGFFLLDKVNTKWNNKAINIVEIGSGNGLLISGIYDIFSKFHAKNINFFAAEQSEFNRKGLEEKLPKAIKIHENFSEINLENKPTIFISNELLDAYPVDQYVKNGRNWTKIFVKKDGEKLIKIASKNFDKNEILSHIDEFYSSKNIPNIIEIPKQAINDFRTICKTIKNLDGGLLFIDYGYTNNPGKNTIQAVKNHKKVDLLTNPTECDITHLVNFEIYKKIASDIAENNKTEVQNQGDFLYENGLFQLSEIYKKNAQNQDEIDKINQSTVRLTQDMGKLFKVLICF